MTSDKARADAKDNAATKTIAAGLVIPGDHVVLNGKCWLVVDGSTGEHTRTLTLVRNTTTRTIRPAGHPCSTSRRAPDTARPHCDHGHLHGARLCHQIPADQAQPDRSRPC